MHPKRSRGIHVDPVNENRADSHYFPARNGEPGKYCAAEQSAHMPPVIDAGRQANEQIASADENCVANCLLRLTTKQFTVLIKEDHFRRYHPKHRVG